MTIEAAKYIEDCTTLEEIKSYIDGGHYCQQDIIDLWKENSSLKFKLGVVIPPRRKGLMSTELWRSNLQETTYSPAYYLFDYVDYGSNTKDNPQLVTEEDFFSFIYHPLLQNVSEKLPHLSYGILASNLELVSRGHYKKMLILAYNIWWEVIAEQKVFLL